MWDPNDRRMLSESARRKGFQYSHNYEFGGWRGFVPPPSLHGPGLLVLSRHPIKRTELLQYYPNGNPLRFDHGDWRVGKGIGYAQVDVGGSLVDIFVTHTLSDYMLPHYKHDLFHMNVPRHYDEYYYQRLAQFSELAHFVNERSSGALAIVCGDLNVLPEMMEMSVLQAIAKLHDSHVVAGSGDGNTHHFSKRIDYILFRSKTWNCIKSEVVLTCMDTDPRLVLSDHFAVAATFRPGQGPAQLELPTEAITFNAAQHLSHGLVHIQRVTNKHLIRSVLSTIFALYFLRVSVLSFALVIYVIVDWCYILFYRWPEIAALTKHTKLLERH